MKMLWQFKQKWKIWPYRSRSYQGQSNHSRYLLGHKCCFVQVWVKSIHNGNVIQHITIKTKLKKLTLSVKVIQRSRSNKKIGYNSWFVQILIKSINKWQSHIKLTLNVKVNDKWRSRLVWSTWRYFPMHCYVQVSRKIKKIPLEMCP